MYIFTSKTYIWHGFYVGFLFVLPIQSELTTWLVAEVMKKSNEASNRTKNAKKQEACPPTQKKASKPKEQKTIASFFSKKN